MSKVKVAALILCAGKSSRMAPDHKLLLKVAGTSLLKTMALEVLESKFFDVMAITGYEEELVAKELLGLPIMIIHNRDYEKGLHSSIRRGVMNLSLEADFFAVCLADQPLFKSSDYNELIDVANQNPDKKLIAPIFNGKRGNPVLISKDLIPDILSHPDDDRGCFYLFEKYKEDMVLVEMKNDASLFDVDTPALFQDVKFHLEKRGYE